MSLIEEQRPLSPRRSEALAKDCTAAVHFFKKFSGAAHRTRCLPYGDSDISELQKKIVHSFSGSALFLRIFASVVLLL